MTNVTMKAVDTLHLSNVGPDNIAPGGEFTVSETEAKQLEDRGLATRVGEAAEKPSPENKQEAAPENKLLSAASVKTPRKGKGA